MAKKTTKITFSLVCFIIFFIFIFSFGSAQVEDQHKFPLVGYAWSENIGWVDFSPENGGVVLELDGSAKGYAWSENIGWIKFHDLENFPGEPYYDATVDMDGSLENCEENNICGWVKALAGEDEDDGWNGWINLGYKDSNYNVSFEENTGDTYNSELVGWGWGFNVVGGVSFNCKNEGNCDEVNYKAESDFYPARPEISFDVEHGDYCNNNNPDATLIFNYESDFDVGPDSYELEIIEQDSGIEVLNQEGPFTETFIIPSEELDFDTDYLIRVRVEDNYEVSSEWEEEEFTTLVRHPQVDFTWNPLEPRVNQQVEFNDKTNYYDWEYSSNRNSNIILRWLFPDSAQHQKKEGPREGFSQVFNEFNEEGNFEITLEVESNIKDGEGGFFQETCSKTKEINMDVQLPDWEETYPFSFLNIN